MTARINHADWQQQVTDLAKMYGWQVLHVRKSIGKGKRWQTTTSIVGWPDIWAWKPGRGFFAIEIKVAPDRVTDEQRAVLLSLRDAGAEAVVAYPEDLPAIQALLSRR